MKQPHPIAVNSHIRTEKLLIIQCIRLPCCLRMEAKQSQTKKVEQEEWITVASICIRSTSGWGNKCEVWPSKTKGHALAVLGSHPDNFHLYPAASAGRKWGMGPPQCPHMQLHSGIIFRRGLTGLCQSREEVPTDLCWSTGPVPGCCQAAWRAVGEFGFLGSAGSVPAGHSGWLWWLQV